MPEDLQTRFGDEVIETLASLVAINSVNPNYVGGVDEQEIAEYIEQFFLSRGIEVRRQDVLPGRPNVIARIPGRDPNRKIIFEAHMDTVSVQGMSIAPWDPEIRDGKLFGRGSCDTKGGIAAMMHAVASLAESQLTPACDVWFAATIDEEYSYRGVWALCNDPPFEAEAAIVAEPTSLQAVVASKGVVRWKIETRGKSAHSSKPHLGVSAIEHMARVILRLEDDTRELAQHAHPLLGPATCNVGVVRGGTQINFVPDRCEVEIDRRMLPNETTEQVLAHYQKLLEDLAAQHASFDFVMHPPLLTDWPLATDPTHPVVQKMAGVLSSMGLDSQMIGVPFCCDASKFGLRGIPSLILGPGSIDQAHSAIEYIECSQVLQAAEIYRRYMLAFE
jgi:acetylornithine deacetylase/succinyl-diaminopimelate desuccinylase family protein